MVGGAIRELERHRLLAHAHANRVTVDVEEPRALEQLAARALDALRERLAGDVLVNDDGQVVRDGWERGHVLVGQLATCQSKQRYLRQLERDDVLGDAEVGKRRGVHVAHPAQQLALGVDLGGTARLQPWVLLGLGGLEPHLGDAQGRKQALHNALRVKEVKLVMLLVPAVLAPGAGEHAAHVTRLVGKRAVLVAKEHATLLVKRHV